MFLSNVLVRLLVVQAKLRPYFIFVLCAFLHNAWLNCTCEAGITVGAAIVDVSPQTFPVLVNGGMTSRTANQITTTVNARAIVVSDGRQTVAMMVVDSCMIPKILLDDVKRRAAKITSLDPDSILISATHTHTAPSVFGALGTDADMTYIPYLREKLVDALVRAEKKMQSARVGWVSCDAAEFTAVRRWIRRPDRVGIDPFGNPTVRANMHAASNPDNVTGPSAAEDPELSMIAFETTNGKPIAVLCNFSMHYFSGEAAISADYFGHFCNAMEDRIEEQSGAQDFVAIMSHGCSGDIWRHDYAKGPRGGGPSITEYSNNLKDIAYQAYQSVKYHDVDSLSMAERRLPMQYRVPDQQRLQWAQGVVEKLGDELPKTKEEIYAREQLFLHELKTTTIVQQAIRIGDIAIATTPNETYALTGMKIKSQSPLAQTMVIELANGADGYIPPPEQHHLGGYNTWAARSAGLEVQAESKITATALDLLEKVCDKPRRRFEQTIGPVAKNILGLDPTVFFRCSDFAGSIASDSSGNGHHGVYEPGVVFFLEGPSDSGFSHPKDVNRCAHFAGGRLVSRLDDVSDTYTVTMSFWNGMPLGARDISGWLFSRDFPDANSRRGESLGVVGKGEHTGRLVLRLGKNEEHFGETVIDRWQWYHVAMARSSENIRVYLNNKLEIDIPLKSGGVGLCKHFFVGGSGDNRDNWEGRLDEIAIFDRVLTETQIRSIYSRRGN